jgi:hypothetical protein
VGTLRAGRALPGQQSRSAQMRNVIYLIGLVVVVIAVLSLAGIV